MLALGVGLWLGALTVALCTEVGPILQEIEKVVAIIFKVRNLQTCTGRGLGVGRGFGLGVGRGFGRGVGRGFGRGIGRGFGQQGYCGKLLYSYLRKG